MGVQRGINTLPKQIHTQRRTKVVQLSTVKMSHTEV